MEDKRAKAQNPTTPATELKKLAKQYPAEVAANPNTPPALLLKLATLHPKEVLSNPALDLIALENPQNSMDIVTRAKRAIYVESIYNDTPLKYGDKIAPVNIQRTISLYLEASLDNSWDANSDPHEATDILFNALWFVDRFLAEHQPWSGLRELRQSVNDALKGSASRYSDKPMIALIEDFGEPPSLEDIIETYSDYADIG